MFKTLNIAKNNPINEDQCITLSNCFNVKFYNRC